MTRCIKTEAIWSQLSEALRRFIRRRVSDDHTTDDLLQETFLRVQRNIDSLRSADRLAPWVYQIARSVIHDHYRARHGGDDVLSPQVVDEREAPMAEASCAHGAQWLDELIGQLPQTYQSALRLAEIEGLSQQGVADRLGMSLSGAKSRIQRGRALLKEALERCCVFHVDVRGNLVDIDPKPDRTACRDCDV